MPNLAIDPTKGAKYPIKIADQLLRNNQQRKRHNVAVQCTIPIQYHNDTANHTQVNHRPKLSQSVTTTKIKPSSQPKAYNLSIKIDADGSEYTYTGSQRPVDDCILIYDPNTETLSLDRLDTAFDFNLRSTPTNVDSRSLKQQYPHIDDGTSEKELDANDGLFGGDAEEDEAGDPNNPYDYRHFMHAAKRQRTASPEASSSYSLSPMPRPSIEASPLQRPVQPAPKPKPRPRPQQKRPAPPPPKEEADADNEDSDDGGLIIEMEPETNKRRNRFMGAFDQNATSTEPISLRSAASSMSPAARLLRREPSEESDEDEDVDILEDLKLPSPRRSPPARTPQEEAEEEADLEAELEMALQEGQAEEGDGDVGLGITGAGGSIEASRMMHDESSEESEEE